MKMEIQQWAENLLTEEILVTKQTKADARDPKKCGLKNRLIGQLIFPNFIHSIFF